jgi:hypothetical protein
MNLLGLLDIGVYPYMPLILTGGLAAVKAAFIYI